MISQILMIDLSTKCPNNMKIKNVKNGKEYHYQYDYKQVYLLPEAKDQLKKKADELNLSYSDLILKLLKKRY